MPTVPEECLHIFREDCQLDINMPISFFWMMHATKMCFGHGKEKSVFQLIRKFPACKVAKSKSWDESKTIHTPAVAGCARESDPDAFLTCRFPLFEKAQFVTR
jgi:hypothetical protein